MAKKSAAAQRDQNIPIERLISILLVVFALIVMVYIVFSGFYTVREYEKAVVLRFGRYIDTKPPGLHFKIPWVDERILVDMAEKSVRLPFGVTEPPGSTSTFQYANAGGSASEEDTLILTGDLYASIVEWNVIWRVQSPEKFLFSIDADHMRKTIDTVAQSVMHRIVGDYSADEVLTDKREEIARLALEETKATLTKLDCGVEIIDLQLQRVTPPSRVKPAFDDVNASIQERDKLINSARKERNSLIPKANADADKLLREAEGYEARRRAETEGEISAILAKYEAYRLAPEVTRRRLYLEMMERVLSNSGNKIILDEQLKSLLPVLPLDKR